MTLTIQEMARLGGLASAKKRLGGKTKEEISEHMKKVRKAKKIKPTKWSRKGRCPGCNVSTGSKHNKVCKFTY